MTPEQFAYWLRGMTEANPKRIPTEQEWNMVMHHLAFVFKNEMELFKKPTISPVTAPYAHAPQVNPFVNPTTSITSTAIGKASDPFSQPMC